MLFPAVLPSLRVLLVTFMREHKETRKRKVSKAILVRKAEEQRITHDNRGEKEKIIFAM